ncbi:hypothetical protein K08M3_50790 [Vibrio alginolyticus]|uniref:Uncharacterized protein n=1 Tax=Vibrio alginolyticus TaxID=663 RepID=A0A1W6TLK8_VIBAL|nr:hypothetical protein K04M1_50660 [Vibrio alginolyticus]ARP11722.1 hypothetical protein K04M3_51530 [Vibrio alginolyticus]ARP16775.1 hypothetical protein K04M5_51230 [Vibrio alginolyticus]ARP21812.1 hypothetical protein K05K4_51100 [Vibrio alginolyticus]ARP26900.1 hypothetical protein K06K5_51000 [Vibrio alginolyticus]
MFAECYGQGRVKGNMYKVLLIEMVNLLTTSYAVFNNRGY